jgi:hypothetical protein
MMLRRLLREQELEPFQAKLSYLKRKRKKNRKKKKEKNSVCTLSVERRLAGWQRRRCSKDISMVFGFSGFYVCSPLNPKP